MLDSTVVVHYDRTDYGRVYLSDIGMRNQLGGGKGLYSLGQDRYMSYGQDATLVKTGDVLMSIATGTIKMMTDLTSFTISY